MRNHERKHKRSVVTKFVNQRMKLRRDNGTYQLDLRAYKVGVVGLCPPGSRSATTCPDEANDLAEEFYRQNFDESGNFAPLPTKPPSPTLSNFLEKYVTYKTKKKKRAPSTIKKIRQTFDTVHRYFKDVLKISSPTVDNLNDGGVIDDFDTWRREQRTRAGKLPADSTVRNDMANIAGLLTFALQRELIESSASQKLELPEAIVECPRFPLERAEAALLLVCAWVADRSRERINKGKAPRAVDRRHMSLGHRAPTCMFPLVATFLLTGGRLQEVLRLTWGDVDFGRREIRLHQTKTLRSANTAEVRYVPLMPQLHAVLMAYRLQCPRWTPDALLFTGREGDALKDFRGSLKELIARAGIPSVMTAHYFRHTFAAMRCQTVQGGKAIDLLTVAHDLGQSNLSQLRDTYGHILQDPVRYPDVRYPLAEILDELAHFDPSSDAFDWAALEPEEDQ